ILGMAVAAEQNPDDRQLAQAGDARLRRAFAARREPGKDERLSELQVHDRVERRRETSRHTRPVVALELGDIRVDPELDAATRRVVSGFDLDDRAEWNLLNPGRERALDRDVHFAPSRERRLLSVLRHD